MSRSAIVVLFVSLIARPLFAGTQNTEPVKPVADVNVDQINQHFGKGVTPDKNAVVWVYRAFGPHPEKATIPELFFKKLGIQTPPEQGDYFQPYEYERNAENAPRAGGISKAKQFDKALDGVWSRKECPAVAKWLDDNEKPLATVIEGIHQPEWYSPIVRWADEDGKPASLVMTLLPATQQIRSIARLLTARAHLAIGEKRFQDAWSDILNCHRLGHMQARGSTLIDYLVGVAISNIANDAHVRFIQLTRPSTKTLLEMSRQYQELPPFPAPDAQMKITEKVMLMDVFDELEAGRYEVLSIMTGDSSKTATLKNLALSLVDWKFARLKALEAHAELEQHLAIKDHAQRAAAMSAFAKKYKNKVNPAGVFDGYLTNGSVSAALKETVSNSVISELLPATGAVNLAASRAFCRRQNLATFHALEIYRSIHNEYPESLAQLVPDLLPSSPNDVFSGKPLIYQRTADGFLLYSVGENGRDENGRTFGEDGDDLRIRIKANSQGNGAVYAE